MKVVIFLFAALFFVLVLSQGPPDPLCNQYKHCHFSSHPRKKIAHLGDKPFKGAEADKIFKDCIKLCKDYTTDGYYHPGFQTVAWLKNDGCVCSVDSIGLVVGTKGPECRASDVSC
ncbi:uncharacterized protein IWZ02DRAFT_433938 [Phyllosticta citriasiana]|uniref:uncharacterized protein n=1 Tax=Phyllosticta citriasiana TaxID=595635 RepID=UPI0030FD5DF7